MRYSIIKIILWKTGNICRNSRDNKTPAFLKLSFLLMKPWFNFIPTNFGAFDRELHIHYNFVIVSFAFKTQYEALYSILSETYKIARFHLEISYLRVSWRMKWVHRFSREVSNKVINRRNIEYVIIYRIKHGLWKKTRLYRKKIRLWEKQVFSYLGCFCEFFNSSIILSILIIDHRNDIQQLLLKIDSALNKIIKNIYMFYL